MKKYIYQIMMMFIAVGFVACDSDDDYTAGTPTPANSMQVYFDADNSTDFICAPGEEPNVEIKVSRMNATEEAEVPIICKSATEGLMIPATVKFKAGEKTTTLAIGLGQMEEDKKYSFSLSLGDEYADHYAQLKGVSHYSGYILEASWKTYVKDATITWTVGGTQQTWTKDIERLGSTNRYRIKDFVGSGLDMVFLVGGLASGSGLTGYNKIIPYANYLSYKDGSIDGFYLYDTKNDEYPSWTVGDKTITYLYIMNSYTGYGDYSYISFTEGDGMFGTYSTTYSDGTSDGYNYIMLSFTPIK